MIRFFRTTILMTLLAGGLSGCASPLFAGLTLSEFSFAGSLFSTAATGKGLGEHAMDLATGRDCNFMEGLVRKDRKVCERKSSSALKADWRGLASAADETAQPYRPEPEPRDSPQG